MFEALRHPLHLFRRTALARSVIAALDRPAFRRIDGIPFPICLRAGPNLQMWIAGRVAERAELALFERLIAAEQADTFWDVGANVGLYAFTFLSHRPNGQAIAFEPDPKNADCLERTIVRAGMQSRATVLRRAASDKVGTATFQLDEVAGVTGGLKGGEDSFVQRHYGVKPREFTVETAPLDSLLASRPAPRVVKVDVEGAEALVLAGATQLLNSVRPSVLIELSSGRAQSEAIFAAARYRLIDERTLGPLTFHSLNVLALPEERADSVLAALR
jgi:FkbM family methyltransferase